jgi:hypothetical protein
VMKKVKLSLKEKRKIKKEKKIKTRLWNDKTQLNFEK